VAKALDGQVHVVHAGDRLTVKGVDIQVLPAYNKTKQYHPRSKGHVGYVITLGGQRIYHAGDTDAIPEMRGLKPDVALVPVSGTYVMDVDEALEALKLIEPAMAVPMHYGDIVGTDRDAARFQELSPVPVTVLPLER